MTAHYGGVQIYSTTVPMGGWRGATLLAFAVAIVLALPEARQLTLIGLAGGLVTGGLLILRRARAGSSEARGLTLHP